MPRGTATPDARAVENGGGPKMADRELDDRRCARAAGVWLLLAAASCGGTAPARTPDPPVQAALPPAALAPPAPNEPRRADLGPIKDDLERGDLRTKRSPPE